MAQFRFVEWLLNWLFETTSFDFQYDEGNREKSQKKHGVANEEVEELFKSGNAIPLGVQVSPPVDEERLAIVGPTRGNKFITVVFTIRDGRVRPISARIAHRKERKSYEEIIRKISQGV